VIFLIDQQLPAMLADWFEQKGHQAHHVRDIDMRDAADGAIWRRAIEMAAVVVAKDEDFAARRKVADGPQVLWLRVGNATNRVLRSYLEAAWPTVLPYLEAGEPIVEA
jgi:predicted nuclease of predicted toxin-antitoxin system